MRLIGWSLLAAIGGYVIGLFGGMALVNRFSPNTHDKSVEAAMTAAIFIGPILAVLAFSITCVLLAW
ncbi:MAG: hypothetical protein WCI67_21435 [Chloroflexales bacterium]